MTEQAVREGTETKKFISLFYTHCILFFGGLYRWVTCEAETSCSNEQAREKVRGIFEKCRAGLKGISDVLPGCVINGDVELKEYEKHIRYPHIGFKFESETLGSAIRLVFRIRINPCIINIEDGRYNGHHSKVWVIIQVVEDLDLSSERLVLFYKELEELAVRVEKYVADTYVQIIEDHAQREKIGDIFIRAASVDSSRIQTTLANPEPDRATPAEQEPEQTLSAGLKHNPFRKSFSDMNNLETAINKIRHDELLQLGTRDICLLSTQGRFNGHKPETPEPEKLANELLDKEDLLIWKVGGDLNNEFVYRLNLGLKSIGVGGIFSSRDFGASNENMNKSFRRLAVNFSWLL